MTQGETTAEEVRAIEQRLTERFAAIDGVRAIFPEHAASAVLDHVLERSGLRDAARPVGSVEVDASGPVVRVSARLATLRTVPVEDVVSAAVAVTGAVLGDRPTALEIEFSSIE